MVEHYLFSKADVHTVLEHQKDLFNQALQNLPAETIHQMCKEFGEGSEPTLRAFVDEHWLHVPVIDDAKIECVEDVEARVDERGNPNRMIRDYDTPFYVPGRRVTLAAPFEGDAVFFDIPPTPYTQPFPGPEIVDKEVRVTYERESPVDYEAIKRVFIRTLGEINHHLRLLSESVSHFNGELTGTGRRYALERKTRLDKDAAGMEKFGIPRRKKAANAAIKPVKLFYSYSHKDEGLREELVKHLTILKRQGVLEPWHDRDIEAGAEWNQEIERHLNEAQIILLLISSDFIASPFCWDKEMARAMERHDAGEAVVIPIILRSCDWKGAPFGKLQGLPKDMKPVRDWSDRDQAFTNVAQGIRIVAEKLAENP
jgi:hypothetical protein